MLDRPALLVVLLVCLVVSWPLGCDGDPAQAPEGAADVAADAPDDVDGGGEEVGDSGGDAADEGEGEGEVSPDAPEERPEGCNPLAPEFDCMLPWPSDVFLVADGATMSGRRLVYPAGVELRSDQGESLDPTGAYPADGFSHSPTILATFGQAVDAEGLTFWTGDLDATLRPDHATLLLDTSTDPPTPVPHFAELDPNAEGPTRQALLIRPLVRLENRRRYVVAVQGLRGTDGALIPAPSGFTQLLGGAQPELEPLRALKARYEAEVWPVLEGFGVAREGVQLAWDFTTQSLEAVTADLVEMRRVALAWYREHGAEIVELVVNEAPHEGIARALEGKVRVPLFLTSTAAEQPRMNRGPEGRVAQNGFAEVPFRVAIPDAVASEVGPARLIHYGHGFFGSREELFAGKAIAFMNYARAALIGVDWWGFAEEDVLAIAGAVTNDPGNALRFVDRLQQAMINHIAVEFLAAGPLADHPALAFEGGGTVATAPLTYYGISNGHILGVPYLAMSPTIDRAALSVGGGSYTFMMFRSFAFANFLILARFKLKDPLEQQKWIATIQSSFDPIDPVTWAPQLLSPALPDTPAQRRVLAQIGIGDALVPNVASHLLARSVGMSLLQPAVRPVWGLPDAAAPFDGSALVEFDFNLGVDLIALPGTVATVPTADNPVHESVRVNPPALEMLDAFLRPDGLIQATCEGPCDPE